MESWNYLVFDPIRAMIATTARYIPILIGALLILILGWIIAKILRELTQQLLKAIKFDNLADKAGVSEVLSTGGIKISAGEIISRLVYWLVMIFAFVITLNALWLTVASQLLENLTAYVPKVISALFVLVIGMFLANVVSSIVGTTASNT